MPRKAEPVVTGGAQGAPPPQHVFFDPRFNAGASSSGSHQATGPSAWYYDRSTDPWSNYGNDFAEGNESTMTTEPGVEIKCVSSRADDCHRSYRATHGF